MLIKRFLLGFSMFISSAGMANNTEIRSPFSLPLNSEGMTQSLATENPHQCEVHNRVKTAKANESYLLAEVSLKGIVKFEGSTIGVIETPQGQIQTIKVGDYIEGSHGEIVGFTDNEVQIVETVIDDTGCLQRRKTRLMMR